MLSNLGSFQTIVVSEEDPLRSLVSPTLNGADVDRREGTFFNALSNSHC
jgi:hypothetical protein